MSNQASEDDTREQTRRSVARLISIQRGDDTWSDDDYITAGNILIVFSRYIRTEKLELLAEVRERVVGESFKPSGFDERCSRQEGDNGHITHYETKKDAETINRHQEYQRTELTKLEAEL